MLYSIQFGPGVGRADPGTLILYGSRAAGPPGRQLFVDAFYASPRGQQVVVGSTCPLPGDQILAPDELFPFTLYQVGGKADQLIFACNFGLVVGIVDLLYVANSGPVSCSAFFALVISFFLKAILSRFVVLSALRGRLLRWWRTGIRFIGEPKRRHHL